MRRKGQPSGSGLHLKWKVGHTQEGTEPEVRLGMGRTGACGGMLVAGGVP